MNNKQLTINESCSITCVTLMLSYILQYYFFGDWLITTNAHPWVILATALSTTASYFLLAAAYNKIKNKLYSERS